jgi:hypothetical protein
MIVYGRKAKLLATETLTEKCPGCGMLAGVQLNVVQKYAQVFWIPFIPIGKTGISKCSNCNQVLKLKDMPPSFQASYDTLKAQAKTPVYMYTGIILLAALVGIAVYKSNERDKQNAVFIAAPQKGDIFEIKTQEGQYTLYKVETIKGDTVFVHPHNYETDKATGLAGLKRKGDTAYAAETIELLKPELKQMLEKGDILDVDRK